MASIVDTSRDGLDFRNSDLGRTRARAAVGAHQGRVLISVYVVFLIFIPPSLIIGPLGAFGSPATLTGLLCLALWVVNKLLPHGAFAPRRQPIYLAVTLYVCVLLSSYLWAHVHYMAPDQATGADNFMLINAARLGVLLLAADSLRTVDDVRYVLKWLTRMAAVSATVALLQFLTSFDPVLYLQKIPPLTVNSELTSYASRGAFERVAGTASHPLEFGTMAAMVVVHAINRMFHEREHKVLHVLMVGVIAMGIPISISRSALLSAAIVLIWLIAASPPQRRRQLVAIVFAFVGVVFIAVPGLLGAFERVDLRCRPGHLARPADRGLRLVLDEHQALAVARHRPGHAVAPSAHLRQPVPGVDDRDRLDRPGGDHRLPCLPGVHRWQRGPAHQVPGGARDRRRPRRIVLRLPRHLCDLRLLRLPAVGRHVLRVRRPGGGDVGHDLGA